ncbi:MAG TPA: electron transport complex subunit RsxC [Cytophagales bacterium]|jgi:electron transport complex protein RnfC|nr:electron transport complex subunit RsxC [Cytophagales bacterium]
MSKSDQHIKTFPKGGVHPNDEKRSANVPISELPPPKMVSIPLSQHIGAPSVPVVDKRDPVKVGQIIAKSKGLVSSNIHSSVSGTVTKIDYVLDSTGYKRQAVIIRVKDDEWEESIDRSETLVKDIALEKDEILKKVAEAGIVGLGGATFPAHIKLNIPRGKKADYLILNGVECEPYLTADHRLMLEKGAEIIIGAKILMKALGVEKCVIGIEINKPDAIANLSELCKEYPGIAVQPLKVQYPQGGEKQLIKAVLNREVPSGGLPIDVGVVVHNVGTSFAVYEAIQKNKPLIERIVTVTGKEVDKPVNLRVRIGTPVQDLILAAGGLPDNTGKIISGGPMMGKALNSLEVPVAKGTSGILLMPEEEAHRKAQQVCIRCGQCVSVCPMGLEPYLLMNECEKEVFERAEKDHILDCIECGSCAFVCPSNRALLDYIRLGKRVVTTMRRERVS